jgi:hypothetical protein
MANSEAVNAAQTLSQPAPTKHAMVITIEKDAHEIIATGPPPLHQPANQCFSRQTTDDAAWEIFQGVFGDSQAELGEENPIANPTCSNNSASGVTSEVVTQSGNATPNQLQYLMRQGTGFDSTALPLKSSFDADV